VVFTSNFLEHLKTKDECDEVLAEMSHSPQRIEGNLRIKVPTSMTVLPARSIV